jgi:16S rRNA (guanine966-N2)-methyltransferase
VKISSGWSKGLKIQTPEGEDVRPTRERVRQAAINMLQPWLAEARVLDLFAGSGAVGIEMVSRGAAGARFVEKSTGALACLRANVSEAGLRASKQKILLEPWSIEAVDVHKFIAAPTKDLYELIWADPPYELADFFLEKAALEIPKMLVNEGVFAFECGVEAHNSVGAWSEKSGLTLIKQREYGVSLMTVWQKI